MDPLLRRSLADTRSAGTGRCPDAETLAAFVDGGLSETERRAVEAHAADCGRCSAVVAMTADSAPATVPPVVLPHVRTHDAARNPWRHAYWTVPLATAATVAGLWIASPREAVAPAPTAVVSSNRSFESHPPPVFRDAPAADAAQRADPAESGTASVETSADKPSTPPPASADQVAAAAGNGEQLMARRAETLSQTAPSEVPPSVVAPAPPATAPQNRVEEMVEARRELVGSVAGVSAAVGFATSDGRVQWRLAGTRIERSTDAGASWTAEFTAPRALTTGVAIDAEAAWAAGEQGLVVRRTAGGWATVTAPLPQRVVSIRSTSPTTATITTADGQTFQTTDAGATWH